MYLSCIYDNVEIGCKYILNVITNYPCFEQWSFERMEYRGPLYRLSFCISTTYSKSVTTYMYSQWTQSTVAKNSPARYCVGFIFCAETLRGSLCFFFLWHLLYWSRDGMRVKIWKVSKSRKIVAQCFLITINGLSQVFLKKKW